MKNEEREKEKGEQDDSEDDSIPVPPDQKPVYPIDAPPAEEKPPIDEGRKGPKKIAIA